MKPKIAIIGAGNVGSHILASAVLKNIPADFLLIDRNEQFEKAQVLDIKDILLFSPHSHVKCSDFGAEELQDVDIFVITAGANQKPGETRCQLLGKNISILQSVNLNISPNHREVFSLILRDFMAILGAIYSST